jgi:transposase InsO family protein
LGAGHKIHTLLTDNGIRFTLPPRYRHRPTASFSTHMFEMLCAENGIDHRLSNVRHHWTNGQVERMNRTIKVATTRRFHYDSHEPLHAHLTTSWRHKLLRDA